MFGIATVALLLRNDELCVILNVVKNLPEGWFPAEYIRIKYSLSA